MHPVIIAIPTYNRATSLDRAIRSVLDQDLGTITVLVSDNASRDDTERLCRDLAARDARVVYRRQPLNLGLTANYNWLMRAALERDPERAGYFMFLSDDDWLDRDYCRRCVQRLESDNSLSLVAGRTTLHAGNRELGDDPDVNLLADSAGQRLWDFCQGVVPTGVFAGIMRLRTVSELPPQRQVLGHDWLLLANIAYLGKVITEPATRVHRGVAGASASRFPLAATLGVSRVQAVKPLATIGFFLALECFHRSPVFARLPLGQRVSLAAAAVAALVARRIVPLLERHPHRAPNRAALTSLRRMRNTLRRLDDPPRLAETVLPLGAQGLKQDQWRVEDLERVDACPVCGEAERETLHSALHDQVFAITGGKWDLYRCVACAAAFLDPRPAPHALPRAYGDGYYTHGGHSTERLGHSAAATLRIQARHAYVNRRFGYSLRPASRTGLALAYLDPRLRAAAARAHRHLRLPHSGATLLDIGCGAGEFVAEARAAGWDAVGIDPDPAAVASGCAAGLPISTMSLAEVAASRGGSFDAVTLAHVLEHVPDPVELLALARTALRDNGVLWLATPNLDARGHHRFGRSWMHLDPPRHVVMLGARALDLALARAGFEVARAPVSASGTVASYEQSARIQRGLSPIEDTYTTMSVRLRGHGAGLLSLATTSASEELIRLTRPAVSSRSHDA